MARTQRPKTFIMKSFVSDWRHGEQAEENTFTAATPLRCLDITGKAYRSSSRIVAPSRPLGATQGRRIVASSSCQHSARKDSSSRKHPGITGIHLEVGPKMCSCEFCAETC